MRLPEACSRPSMVGRNWFQRTSSRVRPAASKKELWKRMSAVVNAVASRASAAASISTRAAASRAVRSSRLVSMARSTASSSKDSRRAISSSMSATLSESVTTLRPVPVTSPSARRILMASRTGPRLTRNDSASSSSTSRVPAGTSPTMMRRRSSLASFSPSDSTRMGLTFNTGNLLETVDS